MAELQAWSALDRSSLGNYEITTPEQILQTLQYSRQAAQQWQQLAVKQRLKKLARLNTLLIEQTDSICQLLSSCSGKVATEALLAELIPLLDLNRYYQKHAHAVLQARPIACSPFTYPFATAEISRQAYGVVAIITPWNYPLQLTLSPLLTALVAGNSVIFKLSELSLPIADLILSLCQQLDLPEGLVQAVIGDGQTGQALIDAGPDLVFFTGSLETGRAVMQAAAQHPIPVILELGGKDAMLILADANLERACHAALYGAFGNSGQVCMSLERIYVHKNCYTEFLQQLVSGLGKLKAADGIEGDYGPLCTEAQFIRLQQQYDNAIAQGALASGPLIRSGNFLQPVILWNVTPQMQIMQEESFGPIVAVMAFDRNPQAVELINNCQYGLNGSIFSRDTELARRLANQLELGNWAINDVIKNAGHSGLPFGGVKHSGFGRYRGAEGLRHFSHTVSGLTNRSSLAKEPNWFPYNDKRYELFKGHIDFVYGQGTFLARMWRNWRTLLSFLDYAKPDLRQIWHNFIQSLPWKQDY